MSKRTGFSELRAETPIEILAVMDAYCSATGRCRTELTVEILGKWTEERLRESTIICRVAGVDPTKSDNKSR